MVKPSEHVREDKRLFGSCVLKASVLVRVQNKFVIVRRTDESGGDWTIPGGLVEPTESVEDAAVREAKEEAGLGVKLVRALAVIKSRVVADSGPSLDYLHVIFYGRAISGHLSALDRTEIAEARLATLSEIAGLVDGGRFQGMPSEVEAEFLKGMQRVLQSDAADRT